MSREEGPYAGKTIAEIIHDYAVVRGDLVEQYARDQLVELIDQRIEQAEHEAARQIVTDMVRAGWHQ